MKAIFVILCALPLTGCGDLGNWASLERREASDVTAPDVMDAVDSTPPPAVQASAPQGQAAPTVLAGQQPAINLFCQSVAVQEASGQGFDLATRQRMIQRGYAQCNAIFGRP